jgi:hypothetical protein
LIKLKIRDMTERFSMRETLKSKFGEAEKSVKGSRATKRATEKVKSSDTGKYKVKIVDGVKYMVLK